MPYNRDSEGKQKATATIYVAALPVTVKVTGKPTSNTYPGCKQPRPTRGVPSPMVAARCTITSGRSLMPDEQGFLAAIRERPDDDTPRLIFADWLDDRGDATWGGVYLGGV